MCRIAAQSQRKLHNDFKSARAECPKGVQNRDRPNKREHKEKRDFLTMMMDE
jgi:hypothetical protein